MSTPPLPRGEFSVTNDYVYLNHAAAGVLPAATTAAIAQYAAAHAAGGVLGTFPYDLKLPEYRERIGRFIGARGADVATIANTGAGANVIGLGIDWKRGDEVLLCDNEFPANVIPWLALRRFGVRVRIIAAQRRALSAERLREEMTPQTRLVALSWVTYADGYRHDLAALAQAAHDGGALLCVDAMQGVGALRVDVGALGVDALYAGGAKWMLALHGIGFLYVSPQLSERLEVAMPGWRSLENMWDFHNYEQPFAAEAMRFEGGTPNLLGALSLACAIELFERSGLEAIERHVLLLTDRLCEGLKAFGAQLITKRGQSCSSGIVTFRFAGTDSMALGSALEKEGFVTTYRTGGIRVSPHGYNTVDEIDAIVEAVARLVRGKVSVQGI